jgi:hypothetical protein
MLILFLMLFSFIDLTSFDIEIKNTNDLISNVIDKSSSGDSSTNIGTNSTININKPELNATIGDRGINNIAAAISSAGGVTAGLKVAQHIGGTPSTKIAVGLASMMVVQAGTSVMSKVLNKDNSTNKLVSSLIFSKVSNNNTILSDYPLNLLVDVNLLLYAALLFLIVIFNIYLANYLVKKDISKFLPKNKFTNILNILINRYIKM